MKCNKETPHSDARYILNLLLADQSGGLWVSAFNEESRTLLGVDARDIRTYREHVLLLSFLPCKFSPDLSSPPPPLDLTVPPIYRTDLFALLCESFF